MQRILLGLALLVSLVAALDPARSRAAILGPLLAALAWLWERRGRGTARTFLPAVTVVFALAVGGVSDPQLVRADFTTYYCYLRSLFFDHDLDFRNEADFFEVKPQPLTPVGRWPNSGTIGAALLWSPFYVVAHGYVRAGHALGFADHAADGYSLPYFRSTLAGTVVFAVLGAWALGTVIARRLPASIAAMAVLAAVGTSPILFYTFVQPGMVHGLTFALACFVLRAADDADRAPSARAWTMVGFLGGLLVLLRPQAVLFSLAVIPLVATSLRSRKVRPLWLAAGVGAALLALGPQLFAWKYIYGQWLPVGGRLEAWAQQLPPGRESFFRYSSWFDPRALHLSDVLFGADRGLFSWSPALLPAMAALVFALRRFGWLAAGGIVVFLGTAWFNACLATPTAGDSFGARRFDVVVPFAALGFAVLLDACARRPLLVPAGALAVFVLWNVGLIGLYRRNAIPFAAPLERVAGGQVRQARRVAESVFEPLAGPDGRAFVYRFFVGEYFFWNATLNGIIDLGDVNTPHLAGGWSGPVNRAGPPRYRTALYPRSCVRFPLMVAAGLEVTVSAKAPGRLVGQTMSVSLNGHPGGIVPLGDEWTEAPVRLPLESAVPGENLPCLEFGQGMAKAGEDRPWAAQVRRIEIRSQSPNEPTPTWGRYR